MAERLIDAGALDKVIEFYQAGYSPVESRGNAFMFKALSAVRKMVADAPTIDAVAVTRCRECKFHNHKYCVDPDDLYCLRKDCYMTRNDYCSYGERRSE